MRRQRGKDRHTELLLRLRVTRPGRKVRSDTVPHRWTARARLLPPPTDETPAEGTGTPPPKLRREPWSGREGGTGTRQPGDRRRGLARQPGGHALRPRKPPPPHRPVALRRGNIRKPRPDPGEPPLLRPGQTGRGRERGRARRTERGTERGTETETENGSPGGADPDPEARGGAAPQAGLAARRLLSGGGGAVARSPESESERGSARGSGRGR